MLAQCYLANGEGQKVSRNNLTDRLADRRRRFVALHVDDRVICSVITPPLSSGSAVFPGGSDGGGEGGVPDETDGQRGGGACCIQPQITLLQQGTERLMEEH